MTPERWQKVKDIFQTVVDLQPDKRAVLLATTCADDAELRAEVEALLEGHDQASRFIEQPAAHLLETAPDKAPLPSLIGQQVGPYKVLREIGHGGMGQVYLAVRADDEYKKRVALKIVKRGMDTQDIVRRFRYERQILAGLDHPHIGKLLDGGTTAEGLPYFAMEYVEGKPITDYCDSRKLSTVERLKLFRQVCAAVQFAHQNLVVHRDIKPSNILVAEDGTPKLLDFGIAKLLNPELSGQTIDPTASVLRLMTPEYASPEQVRGEPITTASDVYSLGVVLYELLTGHRPYRTRSRLPHEILRIICEEEPEKPSTAVSRVEEVHSRDGSKTITLTPEAVSRTREGEPDKLRRKLRGDLDNIVMMAMRKEPQRRYTTVNQLSEDIRRHMEGLPVVARQDKLGYRAEKFVKRNKVVIAAAALITVTLLGGIVATTWQARKAERRFNDVRELAHSFMFEFHDEIEKLPRSIEVRKKLVQQALKYLRSLEQETGNDLSLQLELAQAYHKIGDVQGKPFAPNLGDTHGAVESYRKALEITKALYKQDPKNADVQHVMALSYDKGGDAEEIEGNIREAVESRRKAVDIFEALSKANPVNSNLSLDLANCYSKLGNDLGGARTTYRSLNDTSGALKSYGNALVICNGLSSAEPMNIEAQLCVALNYDRIGGCLEGINDISGMLESYRKALEIRQTLAAANPNRADIRRSLAIQYLNINLAMTRTMEYAKALENLRKAEKIFKDLASADPMNDTAHKDLALCYNNLAFVLSIALPVSLHDPATALSYAKRAVEMSQGKNYFVPDTLVLDTLAWAYHDNGDHFRAIDLVEQAMVKLDQNSYRRSIFEADLAKFKAATHYQARHYTQAIEMIEKALTLLREDRERRPVFEADLAKYKAAAASKAK